MARKMNSAKSDKLFSITKIISEQKYIQRNKQNYIVRE